MADLTYLAISSLDGYVADENGNFDWAEPDEEVHAFVNDLERGVGTYLYGRRMYEVMQAWETLSLEGQEPHIADFARIWRAADKVVYSTTSSEVASERTRVERLFDPQAIRQLKAEAERPLAVAGPTLAAEAWRAGLVDVFHLVLAPAVVGGGTRALPDGVRLGLELVDERRFASGFVFLGYRVRT